jgi:multisubunit Na+/H+ antiporter MnhB subunit
MVQRDYGIGNAETLRLPPGMLDCDETGESKMRNVMRAMVALVGLFNLALGIGFLVDPAQAGLRFFLTSMGTQGLATMRADFTAFFVTGAAFALIAAWRAWRTPLLVPLSLLSIAITGRSISLVADGAPGIAFTPMIVEAIMIVLLALGWRAFDREARA